MSTSVVNSREGERVDPEAALPAFMTRKLNLYRALASGCILSLATSLNAKSVLSWETHNKVSTPGLPDVEKSLLLLNEVEGRIGTTPAAFSALTAALQEEASLRYLAAQLWESYYAIQGTASAISSPSLGPIARYARYLREYYKDSPISQDYKWPVSPSTRYVNLALIKQRPVNRAKADEFTKATLHGDIDEIMNQKESVCLEDVLKPTDDRALRFVLVEGPPGVGKSMFSWELCRRWDEIEAMRRYELVLHLSLREERIQRATRVEELFFHPLADLQQKVTRTVVEREGEGTLVILDGADEVPSSIRQDYRSLFFQLVSRSYLRKATVLVTTRPSATAGLVSKWKPQKRIEILGFTKAQIYEYAETSFSSEELVAFNRYISLAPAVRSMMYIPLNTVIVVQVYRENKTAGKPVPTTLTQLYGDLACILLQRYMFSAKLLQENGSLPQSIQDFPEEVKHPFATLAEVAFHGIVRQQIVFQRLPEGTVALGFTSATPELHTGRRLSYSFLHLTLQEYLAAFHIAHLPPEKQKEVFLAYHSLPHFRVVWRFVAGLTGFKGIGWDIVVDKTQWRTPIVGNETWNFTPTPIVGNVGLCLLQYLYESQDTHLCASVLGTETRSFIDLDTTDQPLDCFIVGYCIAHSSYTWNLGYFLHWQLGPEHVEMLAQGLKSGPLKPGSIHSLILNDSPLQYEGVVYLQELPLEGISELGLSHCNLDARAFGLLTHSVLPRIVATITTLDLSDNLVNKGDSTQLLQGLMTAPNLHTLCLEYIPLGLSEIAALAELIAPQTGCLRRLYIGGNVSHLSFWAKSIGPTKEHVDQLVSIVFSDSSLHVLHLICIDFTPHMTQLALLLENNSNLTQLSFVDCSLDDSRGGKLLARALSKNTTLQTLEISRGIGKEGALALSAALGFGGNRTLKVLKLTEYDHTGRSCIGRDGAVALVNTLRFNKTLQELTLGLPDRYKNLFSPALDPRVKFI